MLEDRADKVKRGRERRVSREREGEMRENRVRERGKSGIGEERGEESGGGREE